MLPLLGLAAGAISALSAGEIGILGASAGIAGAIGASAARNSGGGSHRQERLPEPERRHEPYDDLDDDELDEAVRLAMKIIKKNRKRR
jgi:hypothetical protein